MGESHHHQAATSSRFGIRNTGGEIVEVQGGHIVRSTGRKDRHSKVCTAKGPRDRRVRLSAHTAIQFYDVQDRLGYDRPSKAVDWLIKKAKPAIDELAELPAWKPTTASATTTTTAKTKGSSSIQQDHTSNDNNNNRGYQFPMENFAATIGSGTTTSSTNKTAAATTTTTTIIMGNDVQDIQQMAENPDSNRSSFLPPSLESDAIVDTIKSFFPMGAASAETPPSSMQFQNFPPDLLSRTSSQSQDLRLSLQSFQEPILLQPQAHHHPHSHNEQQVLFSGTGAANNHHQLGFDGASNVGWFQRMVGWNVGSANDADNTGTGCGGGFMFSQPPLPPPHTVQQPLLQPLCGQNQFFTQRGPLQSSNTPSIRAWIDQPISTTSATHHQIPLQIHHQLQSAITGVGFATGGRGGGGFSGFHIPARIQGEEEEHDGIHNRPSSASSDSRH